MVFWSMICWFLKDKYVIFSFWFWIINYVVFLLSKINYLLFFFFLRIKGYVKFELNRIKCECLLCEIKYCIVNFLCMGESL